MSKLRAIEEKTRVFLRRGRFRHYATRGNRRGGGPNSFHGKARKISTVSAVVNRGQVYLPPFDESDRTRKPIMLI